MKSELEVLKQKVLEELKDKSSQLEREADDLENERVRLEQILTLKETEFAKHTQEVSDAHEKHLKDVTERHEQHLNELNDGQAKQIEVLQ